MSMLPFAFCNLSSNTQVSASISPVEMRLSCILVVVSAVTLLIGGSMATEAGRSVESLVESTDSVRTLDGGHNDGNQARFLRARKALDDDDDDDDDDEERLNGANMFKEAKFLKAFDNLTYAKKLYGRWSGHGYDTDDFYKLFKTKIKKDTRYKQLYENYVHWSNGEL
ncbi:unnamed protein product [Phytophthora lilii]|uniref:RxLR effector protein n=1 Tax=Phytophthora lilii TaxID=2077276 RepID=A0A9W6TQT6_9STRA|nr:unnamed protein product [Phytophthora lilii]